MTERLILLKTMRVPDDLDIGSEPQCNKLDVWMLSLHMGENGTKCTGSGSLVYNTGLTSDSPFNQQAVCDFGHKTFSTNCL